MPKEKAKRGERGRAAEVGQTAEGRRSGFVTKEPTITRASSGFQEFGASVDEMRRLYAEGDAEAALDIAKQIYPVAHGMSLASIPMVVKTQAELREMPLDHRAAFLLQQMDGACDLEAVLDVSGMPETEALAIVEVLLSYGAVVLLPPFD